AVPSLTPPARAPVAAAPVVLATKGMSKTFTVGGWFAGRREVAAVKSVDLHVRRGETLGVVGESGSGKTTVARCIARLIAPSEGATRSEDADVPKRAPRAPRPHRKRVQAVSQDPSRPLNPRRTGGEPIAGGPVTSGATPPAAFARAREL